MTQPLDMKCTIEPQGEIDEQAGEFWVTNPFAMLSGEHNFSAYETNKMLLNRPGKSFLDLSIESGADIDSDSRSAIAADFDRDGDLDLLVGSVGGGAIRLFENQVPSSGHRVRIDLQGAVSNQQGIGTQVRLTLGEQQITRDMFAVNGFMGQAPAELIVGVGQAEKIDRLEVRWPSGQTQEFTDLPVDTVIGITEAGSEPLISAKSWLPTVWEKN